MGVNVFSGYSGTRLRSYGTADAQEVLCAGDSRLQRKHGSAAAFDGHFDKASTAYYINNFFSQLFSPKEGGEGLRPLLEVIR